MTRKSKAHKDKRAKEPEIERFRTLEELNQDFCQRKGGFRSLVELTTEFQEVQPVKTSQTFQKEVQAVKPSQALPKEVEPATQTHGTGILKKIFEGRGFGFIAPDQDHGAGDIFLHFSDINGGGARNLSIGTWVRYDVEPDVGSGRLRAKNVAILPSTPSTTASESPNVSTPTLSLEVADIPSSTACAYDRDIMIGIFKALHATSRFRKNPIIKYLTVPMPPSTRSSDQEDPCLDDERLLARLEARLDKETGADALNMQTFGACSVGWTFEEALTANEKLRIVPDVVDELVDRTTVGGSFSSQRSEAFSSQRSEDSDTSEYRREARQEVLPGDKVRTSTERTWSWEQAAHDCKVVEDHRQTWEVDQKQQQALTAAPPLVFQ